MTHRHTSTSSSPVSTNHNHKHNLLIHKWYRSSKGAVVRLFLSFVIVSSLVCVSRASGSSGSGSGRSSDSSLPVSRSARYDAPLSSYETSEPRLSSSTKRDLNLSPYSFPSPHQQSSQLKSSFDEWDSQLSPQQFAHHRHHVDRHHAYHAEETRVEEPVPKSRAPPPPSQERRQRNRTQRVTPPKEVAEPNRPLEETDPLSKSVLNSESSYTADEASIHPQYSPFDHAPHEYAPLGSGYPSVGGPLTESHPFEPAPHTHTHMQHSNRQSQSTTYHGGRPGNNNGQQISVLNPSGGASPHQSVTWNPPNSLPPTSSFSNQYRPSLSNSEPPVSRETRPAVRPDSGTSGLSSLDIDHRPRSSQALNAALPPPPPPPPPPHVTSTLSLDDEGRTRFSSFSNPPGSGLGSSSSHRERERERERARHESSAQPISRPNYSQPQPQESSHPKANAGNVQPLPLDSASGSAGTVHRPGGHGQPTVVAKQAPGQNGKEDVVVYYYYYYDDDKNGTNKTPLGSTIPPPPASNLDEIPSLSEYDNNNGPSRGGRPTRPHSSVDSSSSSSSSHLLPERPKLENLRAAPVSNSNLNNNNPYDNTPSRENHFSSSERKPLDGGNVRPSEVFEGRIRDRAPPQSHSTSSPQSPPPPPPPPPAPPQFSHPQPSRTRHVTSTPASDSNNNVSVKETVSHSVSHSDESSRQPSASSNNNNPVSNVFRYGAGSRQNFDPFNAIGQPVSAVSSSQGSPNVRGGFHPELGGSSTRNKPPQPKLRFDESSRRAPLSSGQHPSSRVEAPISREVSHSVESSHSGLDNGFPPPRPPVDNSLNSQDEFHGGRISSPSPHHQFDSSVPSSSTTSVTPPPTTTTTTTEEPVTTTENPKSRFGNRNRPGNRLRPNIQPRTRPTFAPKAATSSTTSTSTTTTTRRPTPQRSLPNQTRKPFNRFSSGRDRNYETSSSQSPVRSESLRHSTSSGRDETSSTTPRPSYTTSTRSYSYSTTTRRSLTNRFLDSRSRERPASTPRPPPTSRTSTTTSTTPAPSSRTTRPTLPTRGGRPVFNRSRGGDSRSRLPFLRGKKEEEALAASSPAPEESQPAVESVSESAAPVAAPAVVDTPVDESAASSLTREPESQNSPLTSGSSAADESRDKESGDQDNNDPSTGAGSEAPPATDPRAGGRARNPLFGSRPRPNLLGRRRGQQA